MKKLILGSMLFVSNFISISWIYSNFVFDPSTVNGFHGFPPFLVVNHQGGLFIINSIVAIYGLKICIEAALSKHYLDKK